ncbi:hypothetical protein FOL47_004648, partial [Perkinsus chesapeaki]
VLGRIFHSEESFAQASIECPLGTITATLIEMGVCFQREFLDPMRSDSHRAHLEEGCYKDNWERFLSLIARFRSTHASIRVFMGEGLPSAKSGKKISRPDLRRRLGSEGKEWLFISRELTHSQALTGEDADVLFPECPIGYTAVSAAKIL